MAPSVGRSTFERWTRRVLNLVPPTPASSSGGVGGFVVACIVLFLVGSRSEPESSSEPRFAIREDAELLAGGVRRITLDVRTADRWVALDFGQHRAHDGEPDIYVQRSVFRAPKGAVDLGLVALEDAKLVAPIGGVKWQGDRQIDGKLQNPAIGRWYSYSYWTHLLKSKGHTYAVRRSQDSVAFFRVVSYYCLPESSGCMTIEYRVAGG